MCFRFVNCSLDLLPIVLGTVDELVVSKLCFPDETSIGFCTIIHERVRGIMVMMAGKRKI